MMPLVRLGDPLRPYGGEVLEGGYSAFGKPVACVGHKARCEKHGDTYISEGTAGSTLDGKAVALDGHACACGCTLVSTLALGDMAVAP